MLAKNSQWILIHKFHRSSFPEHATEKKREKREICEVLPMECKIPVSGSFSFSGDLICSWKPSAPLSAALQGMFSACKDTSRSAWMSCGEGVVVEGINVIDVIYKNSAWTWTSPGIQINGLSRRVVILSILVHWLCLWDSTVYTTK